MKSPACSLTLLLVASLTGCASAQKPSAVKPAADSTTDAAGPERRAGTAAAKVERRGGPRARAFSPDRIQGKTQGKIQNEIRSELEALRAGAQAAQASTAVPPMKQVETANADATAVEVAAGASPAAGNETGPGPAGEKTLVPRPGPHATAAEAPKPRVPVLVNPEFQTGGIATDPDAETTVIESTPLKRLKTFDTRAVRIATAPNTPLIFELPVTYNDRVKSWVEFFQTEGRQSFRKWLERSNRYLPYIQTELEASGMPQDLIYVAMIESGFSPGATSPAQAVGMWQFIRATANRYGMRTNWWLDERRDVHKSTKAAVAYMRDLYKMFGSWYLVAASYNMGEGGVKRLIKKHGSNDFWELADKGALPEETKNYVPKILAAMLIAKAPGLYGFRDLQYHLPLSYEYSDVPGGTKLMNLAAYLGVSGKYLQELNPELIRGYVPPEVRGHRIRIPKGATAIVSQYVQMLDTGARDANLN